MKQLTSILLFLLCLNGHSQSHLDLKIDSLSVELKMLQQEKIAIENQIQLLDLAIVELSRRRLNQLSDSTISVKCVSSPGCFLTDGPSPSSNVVRQVEYGDLVTVDSRFFTNDYLKVSYKEEVGYLYHGVLEKTPALLVIINGRRNVSSEPVADPSSKQKEVKSVFNGSSPGSYHSIQTGPRGGKYYINSKGNKTYVKKR